MNVPEQFHHQLITFALVINEKISRQFEDIYKDVLTDSQHQSPFNPEGRKLSGRVHD